MALDRVDGALGALLGTVVGDPLGMPFEGRPPGAVPDHVEMADARLGRGTHTDDTEMMILLVESLLEHRSVRDDRLAETFSTGARAGASAIPGRWLTALEDGPRGRSHVERLARALVS